MARALFLRQGVGQGAWLRPSSDCLSTFVSNNRKSIWTEGRSDGSRSPALLRGVGEPARGDSAGTHGGVANRLAMMPLLTRSRSRPGPARPSGTMTCRGNRRRHARSSGPSPSSAQPHSTAATSAAARSGQQQASATISARILVHDLLRLTAPRIEASRLEPGAGGSSGMGARGGTGPRRGPASARDQAHVVRPRSRAPLKARRFIKQSSSPPQKNHDVTTTDAEVADHADTPRDPAAAATRLHDRHREVSRGARAASVSTSAPLPPRRAPASAASAPRSLEGPAALTAHRLLAHAVRAARAKGSPSRPAAGTGAPRPRWHPAPP